MALQVIDPVTGAPRPLKGVDGRIVLSLPANAIAITPGATVYDPPIQVWVGATGDVTVTPYGRAGDSSVTYPGVPAGAMLPVLCKQVTAATAGSLRGQW